MEEKKGLVFNIQRYSLNDGNGIRTIVFFKGCPLRCPWCSNPESQKMETEYMKSLQETSRLKKVGKWYTVGELVKEVLKDEVFFNVSGGGVTLSGGEILMQGEFIAEFLKELKEHAIDTAVETCGYGNTDLFRNILPYIDTVLFDLKIADNEKSKEILKGDFNLIHRNFREAAKNSKVIPRFPYIPGYTDGRENIDKILDIIRNEGLNEIHVLPYHNYGETKYELLDREYALKDVKIPEDSEMEAVRKYIESKGFSVKIGG